MIMPGDEKLIRAFFAIDLAENTKATIGNLIEELQQFYPGDAVRWIKAHSLHITLQFLKQINRQDLDRLIVLANEALRQQPPFEVVLGPVQFFPNTSNPKVITLDTQPQAQLMTLSKIIGQCMTEINFPAETRLFRGHVTLGRFNFNTAKEPVLLQNITIPVSPPVTPHEIILFESMPMPTESRYMPLYHFPLYN
jgi:2'-5' RNA ligase